MRPNGQLAVAILAAVAIASTTAGRADGQDRTTSDRGADVLPDTLRHRPATRSLETVRVVAARPAGYAATGATTTAMKTPTPLRDVPQSVSVVTRALIADMSMQSMADVVRLIPGVTMGQGEGHRDQPTIRGNNTTADFFVDGVRDDMQYLRDLYNVERIEALKGSNALIFGRGGGGGVLNRVTKEPTWTSLREVWLQGGSYDNRRGAIDVDQPFGSTVAARFNGMYERSGVFRHNVDLRRLGVNPTLALAPDARTRIGIGYEYFTDDRTVDRGVPSLGGRPLATDVGTFFGDPSQSYSDARVHLASAVVTRDVSPRVTVRSRSQFGDYDKFYQNVFPGAVNTGGDQVAIAAYNNGTARRNLFNQTEIITTARTGAIRQTLLLGVELGHQRSDNLRRTGYFDNTSTSISVPLADPTVLANVTFRPSASDADNRVTAQVGSVYLQDQVVLSDHWQVVAGVRYERFNIRLDNHRNGTTLRRVDDMVSPRGGVVFKPSEPLSFYGSYGVSYLPSSGDQFASVTDVTRALEPEQFRNREIGAKWDVGSRLSIAAAAYRLDRTRTQAPDPVDPTRLVQTGSQRTNGVEVTVTGRVTPAWEIAAAYANLDAFITSTTSAAAVGQRVPLVPRNALMVWNRYQVARRVGIGFGVEHRSEMFAAIDNRVTLPSFVELDGAVYLTIARAVRVQAYFENLLDERYYTTAHSNNNITPGSPRLVRVGVVTGF